MRKLAMHPSQWRTINIINKQMSNIARFKSLVGVAS